MQLIKYIRYRITAGHALVLVFICFCEDVLVKQHSSSSPLSVSLCLYVCLCLFVFYSSLSLRPSLRPSLPSSLPLSVPPLPPPFLSSLSFSLSFFLLSVFFTSPSPHYTLGGKVMTSPKGGTRVVWERVRKASPNSEKNGVDLIPFLNVSRSLGDFWSYNPRTQKFVVSPTPDVHVYPMDLSTQKFVVVASDGLWNVMTPQGAVNFIFEYENEVSNENEEKDVVSAIIKEALERWDSKCLLADNISVLIAFLSEEDEGESSSTAAGECPAPSTCTETSTVAVRDKESRNPSPVPTSTLPLSKLEVSSSSPSSSPLPVPISLPPLSTCSLEPSLFHSIPHSKSGSLELDRKQHPCGITVQDQSRIKLIHQREHRKNHTLAKRLVRCVLEIECCPGKWVVQAALVLVYLSKCVGIVNIWSIPWYSVQYLKSGIFQSMYVLCTWWMTLSLCMPAEA